VDTAYPLSVDREPALEMIRATKGKRIKPGRSSWLLKNVMSAR
jgi:hypothetical protein